MSKELMHPTMAELAAPYQQPDALPLGIDVSVALIADTKPGLLKEVTGQTFADLATAQGNVQRYAHDQYRSWLDQTLSNATRHRELDASISDTHAAEVGRLLAMGLKEGITPSAQDLDKLMHLQDEVTEDKLRASQTPDDDPSVLEVRREMEAAAKKRAQAEQRVQDLQPANALAIEVQSNVSRLARRGRVASILAGAALMTGVGLGVTEAIEQSQNDQDHVVQTHETPAQTTTNESNENYRKTTVATATLIGGVVGGLVSLPLTGRFAKWRASGMVRRARQK